MGVTTEGKLTVAHSIRIAYGEGDTTNPGASYRLDVNGAGLVRGDFYCIGDMKIDGAGPEGYNLICNGQALSNGWITASDKRIKTNIQPIDQITALEQIIKLEPKTYNFYDNDKKKCGLIAQEVESVLPDAVTSDLVQIVQSIREFCKLINNGKTIVLDTKSTSDILATKLEFDDLSGNRYKVEIESLEGEKYIHLKESIEEHSTESNGKYTIFVRGHEVSDFRAIDYNVVVMTNVAATKELSKELNETIEELNVTRIELNKTITALNELKALVKTLIDK
jgi:hypothetical protein